jgi:hypothetical protein
MSLTWLLFILSILPLVSLHMRSTVSLGESHSSFLPASLRSSSRYFQSQGLFTVPTQIIFVVAPINAVLNYILGIKYHTLRFVTTDL